MSKEQNSTLGQGLVEYALILGLVVIIVVVVVSLLGPQVGNMFSQVTGGFSS
ncbi:MAG: pilus assembly protein [Ardenticatenaceae bacterium]|nr:pilus assembly protein [Ardenticatenaceae bacterium]MCB9443739.1 pilus assembly protein [Ardenticatenaceae bacterium]